MMLYSIQESDKEKTMERNKYLHTKKGLYLDDKTYKMFNVEFEKRYEKKLNYSLSDFIAELITERLESIDNESS